MLERLEDGLQDAAVLGQQDDTRPTLQQNQQRLFAETQLRLQSRTILDISLILAVFLEEDVVQIGEDAENLLQVHIVPNFLAGLLLVHEVEDTDEDVLAAVLHRWVCDAVDQQGEGACLETQAEVFGSEGQEDIDC